VPVFEVDSVDPTGAGDAFCAGVIDSLLDHPDLLNDIQGLSVEDAKTLLLRGSAAGAVCVTFTGATTAVTREKVDYMMREQGDRVRAGILSGRRLI
jgi:sugar/nucleoside kinase (ribokinase family)